MSNPKNSQSRKRRGHGGSRSTRSMSQQDNSQAPGPAVMNTGPPPTINNEDQQKQPPVTEPNSPRSTTMPTQRPNDVSEGYWKILSALHDEIAVTNHTVANIDTKVSAVEKENKELKVKVSTLEKRLDLVEARQYRSEQVSRRHQNQITDLTARSMKSNIIFTFDKSTDFGKLAIAQGDNCETTVKSFLKTVMGIAEADRYYITAAHRLALDANGNRPILAQFPNATQHQMVLKNSSRLKGTKHHINQQIPARYRERNQFAMNNFKDLKQNNTNKVQLAHGKLVLNGKVQSEFLPDILPVPYNVDEEEVLDEESMYPIACGNHVTDGGSTFTGYAASVADLDELATLLDRSLLLDGVSEATHRMYAYRIDNSHTIMENFDADGDDGIGLELLKSMRLMDVTNMVWIVTRNCSKNSKHIGRKRFAHANAVAKSAYELLKND